MHESMDDFMTIILGLSEPEEPGMHGPLKEPCPTSDAVTFVTKVRDMCDEWLRSADKEGDKSKDISPATEVGDNDKPNDDEHYDERPHPNGRK